MLYLSYKQEILKVNKNREEKEMTAKYYSGWTHEQDMELLEVVLENIRNGGTILDACTQYEKMTNGRRSISASKYRFHTQLKEKYSSEYEQAKKDKREARINKKTEPINPNFGGNDEELTIDDVMKVIKRFKQQQENKGNCECEKEMFILNRENEKLRKENQKLKVEMEELQTSFSNNVKQQRQILDALKILEGAGIKMDLPKSKYIVNKDGTVEKV